MKDPKIKKSAKFAALAHLGQRRKYTGAPYIVHPANVAALVQCFSNNPDTICAAWLHDTVEDTSVTLQHIEKLFNSRVAELVRMVTNIAKPEDGNRSERVATNILHLLDADPEAKTIKLADILHNISDIVEHDRDFAKQYLGEKELCLLALSDGHPTLFNIAQATIQQFKRQLC